MAKDEHNYTFLGIDQALRRTGICYLSVVSNTQQTNPPTVQTAVLDTTTDKLVGPARLSFIRSSVREILGTHDITMAAMEQGAYRGSGRVFQLGGVSALIQVELWEHGVPFIIARPDQVKKHFTGYNSASKEQMVERAVELLGREVTDDEADAYALARIAHDMHRDHAGTRKEAEVIWKLREEERVHEPPAENRTHAAILAARR